MNPEFYDTLMGELFELGALDVYTTPIMMKKNRPANKLSVLVKNEDLKIASEKILRGTTTFGVRYYDVNRTILDRKFEKIDTKYGQIKVKIGILDEEILKVVPEYEDCKKIAKAHRLSVIEVYRLAQSEALKIFVK
ncbi:MAG: LarC family nickel insertion protein [Tissierellales bacterium]|jgi:uncharacterized protein (DUF111 family)|nr:LarC family nickel insertion protein [Tissierellales bacterium]